MTLKEKLITIGSGIALFFSAVFYVLFKQAKEEKLKEELKETKEDLEQTTEELKAQTNAIEKSNEVKNENEDKKHNSKKPDLDGFYAGLDLLRK